MTTYYFAPERAGYHDFPGTAIIADSLRQARAYMRKSTYRYLGTRVHGDFSNWLCVPLSKQLREGYDSLVANGASSESLAYYCKTNAFSPKKEASDVPAA